MKVNIGKNTLGDTDKMSVELKEYGRSTHDLVSSITLFLFSIPAIPFLSAALLGVP